MPTVLQVTLNSTGGVEPSASTIMNYGPGDSGINTGYSLPGHGGGFASNLGTGGSLVDDTFYGGIQCSAIIVEFGGAAFFVRFQQVGLPVDFFTSIQTSVGTFTTANVDNHGNFGVCNGDCVGGTYTSWYWNVTETPSGAFPTSGSETIFITGANA